MPVRIICRATGTWILADEVYERLYFEPTSNACAPSFLDVAGPADRLVVVHSFSKSFLMTGWRQTRPLRPRRELGCVGVLRPGSRSAWYKVLNA